MNSRLVSRELKQLADKINSVWPELPAELVQNGAEKNTLDAMDAVLLAQCANALKLVNKIPKVAYGNDTIK